MRVLRIVIFVLCVFQLSAQHSSYCGTGVDAESEKFLTDYFAGVYETKSTNATVWVPVTAHIVSPEGGQAPYTEKDVLDALCTLNSDYSETEMQFYLSSFKYIYNDDYYDHDYSDGIQMMQLNNVPGTANAYFVLSPAGNCGYYAGAGGAVALAFGCNGRFDHTWAHEFGHYFSLPHTFRGWEGEEYMAGTVAPNFINNRKVEKFGDDPDCHIAGDRFCDTPADYISSRWTCNSNALSSIEQTDPDSTKFRSDGTYIMSYSNDGCMTRFSPMQIDAMLSNLQNTKSEQIDNSYVPTGPLSVENTVPLYPINNEVVSEPDVTLDWEEMGDAEFYFLEMSRFKAFQFADIEEWISDTDYDFEGLKDGKKYYWKLSAYDMSGNCVTEGKVDSFQTQFIVGTNEEELSNSFQVYPNPSSSYFTINSTDAFAGVVTIYNNQLQKVDEITVKKTQVFDYEHNLARGLYIIEINNGESKITKKLIVQ